MVAYAFNPNTWEAEGGISLRLETSLIYKASPGLIINEVFKKRKNSSWCEGGCENTVLKASQTRLKACVSHTLSKWQPARDILHTTGMLKRRQRTNAQLKKSEGRCIRLPLPLKFSMRPPALGQLSKYLPCPPLLPPTPAPSSQRSRLLPLSLPWPGRGWAPPCLFHNE